jgi:hypothetical protein
VEGRIIRETLINSDSDDARDGNLIPLLSGQKSSMSSELLDIFWTNKRTEATIIKYHDSKEGMRNTVPIACGRVYLC